MPSSESDLKSGRAAFFFLGFLGLGPRVPLLTLGGGGGGGVRGGNSAMASSCNMASICAL